MHGVKIPPALRKLVLATPTCRIRPRGLLTMRIGRSSPSRCTAVAARPLHRDPQETLDLKVAFQEALPRQPLVLETPGRVATLHAIVPRDRAVQRNPRVLPHLRPHQSRRLQRQANPSTKPGSNHIRDLQAVGHRMETGTGVSISDGALPAVQRRWRWRWQSIDVEGRLNER